MSTSSADDGQGGRRGLTHEECVELLSRPIAGVYSSVMKAGWIHSVPVHFVYRDGGTDESPVPDESAGAAVGQPHDGEIRILVGGDSVKARNADRTGHATFCVEVTDGPDRRYVTIAGTVRVQRPAVPSDLMELDARYGRSDARDWSHEDYADTAMLVLRPDRWIAHSDWD